MTIFKKPGSKESRDPCQEVQQTHALQPRQGTQGKGRLTFDGDKNDVQDSACLLSTSGGYVRKTRTAYTTASRDFPIAVLIFPSDDDENVPPHVSPISTSTHPACLYTHSSLPLA